MLCRPARSIDWLVSVNRNSEFDRIDSSRIECEIVLSSSSGSLLGVASGGQPQLPFVVLQEDVAALGSRQLQRDVEHGHQDFVEHAGRVQLARRFQKQRQLFQVGGFLLDLDAGNLAEKFARRVRGGMRRVEQDVGRIARPKFQPVAALQLLPLDALAVDERAVLAAQIDEEEIRPLPA